MFWNSFGTVFFGTALERFVWDGVGTVFFDTALARFYLARVWHGLFGTALARCFWNRFGTVFLARLWHGSFWNDFDTVHLARLRNGYLTRCWLGIRTGILERLQHHYFRMALERILYKFIGIKKDCFGRKFNFFFLHILAKILMQ